MKVAWGALGPRGDHVCRSPERNGPYEDNLRGLQLRSYASFQAHLSPACHNGIDEG